MVAPAFSEQRLEGAGPDGLWIQVGQPRVTGHHAECVPQVVRQRHIQLDLPGGRAVIAGGLLRIEARDSRTTDPVEVSGPGRYAARSAPFTEVGGM